MSEGIDKELVSDFFGITEDDNLGKNAAEKSLNIWNKLGMPEYIQKDDEEYFRLEVKFANQEDIVKFAKVTGMTVTPLTKTVWYPRRERANPICMLWVDEESDE